MIIFDTYRNQPDFGNVIAMDDMYMWRLLNIGGIRMEFVSFYNDGWHCDTILHPKKKGPTLINICG